MAWLIAYTDGSMFLSENVGPPHAPEVGIVCIVQETGDPNRPRELIRRFDWYWYRGDEGCWYGGDLHGYLDQAMRLGATWPKQGRTMRNDEYEAICKVALDRFAEAF